MASTRPQANRDVSKYKERCAAILAVSNNIRYVGIMNKFGRTVAGALRNGVIPLLKPEEARNEYFIEATRNQLRKNFQNSIGRTEYTLTENERVRILTLSTEDNFYYITLDKSTQTSEVMKVIEFARKMIMA